MVQLAAKQLLTVLKFEGLASAGVFFTREIANHTLGTIAVREYDMVQIAFILGKDGVNLPDTRPDRECHLALAIASFHLLAVGHLYLDIAQAHVSLVEINLLNSQAC